MTDTTHRVRAHYAGPRLVDRIKATLGTRSLMERTKRGLQTLWSALEAAEEGPYGYMDRQISSLNDRVRKLENDRPDSAG